MYPSFLPAIVFVDGVLKYFDNKEAFILVEIVFHIFFLCLLFKIEKITDLLFVLNKMEVPSIIHVSSFFNIRTL